MVGPSVFITWCSMGFTEIKFIVLCHKYFACPYTQRTMLCDVNYKINQLLCTWLCVTIHTPITTSTCFGTVIVPLILFNTSKMIRCNLIYALLYTTGTCERSCTGRVVVFFALLEFMLNVHLKVLKHLRSLVDYNVDETHLEQLVNFSEGVSN